MQIQVDKEFNYLIPMCRVASNGYPVIKNEGYLHHFVMGCPTLDSWSVDHVNGNKLDNRACNLQLIPHSINSSKRVKSVGISKYIGVTYCKKFKVWISRVRGNGKTKSAKFLTEFEAACGRDYLFRLCFPGIKFIPNVWEVVWTPEVFELCKLKNDGGRHSGRNKQEVWLAPAQKRKDYNAWNYIVRFQTPNRKIKSFKVTDKQYAMKWYKILLGEGSSTK